MTNRTLHNRHLLKRPLAGAMTLVTSAVLLGGDAEFRRIDVSSNKPEVASISKPESSKSSHERSKRTETDTITYKPEVVTLSKPERSKSFNERFIKSIADGMRSYQMAKDAGIIEGIMYEPSEKEVVERVKRLLVNSKSGPELEEIAATALEIYKNSKNGGIGGATVFPALLKSDLPGIKRTIVFFEKGLHSEYIKGERELKNLIEHELQHAEDFFYGVWVVEPLAGRMLKEEWDWELWRNLLELRAQYRQMNDIFGIGESSRPLLFKREWLVLQIRRYYRLWSYCKDYQPKNEAWRKIRDSQFVAVKDIYPRREGLTITIMRREGQKEYGIKAEYQDLSQLAGSDL